MNILCRKGVTHRHTYFNTYLHPIVGITNRNKWQCILNGDILVCFRHVLFSILGWSVFSLYNTVRVVVLASKQNTQHTTNGCIILYNVPTLLAIAFPFVFHRTFSFVRQFDNFES